MGKLDAKMEGRNEGMVFALQIVKSGGVEALEEEIRKRNLSGLHLLVPQSELDKAKVKITYRAMDILSAVGMLVLHDKFGFGKKRCNRFKHWLIEKTDALLDPKMEVSLEDYVRTIGEELGIDATISKGLGV